MKIFIRVAITKQKKIYMPLKNVIRIKLDNGSHGLLSYFNSQFSFDLSSTSGLILLKYGYGYGYDVNIYT